MNCRLREFSGNRDGFTLIELMVVVSIIGLLASIGAMNYASAKARAADAAMKSDLLSAMVALEDIKIRMGKYPQNRNQFKNQSGFRLSPGVSWQRFRRRTVKRTNEASVVMVVKHELSENWWKADYPNKTSSIIIK